MGKTNLKYTSIINALKESKPVFKDSDSVADNVMREILTEKPDSKYGELIMNFFFDWVYIGWMRKSLIIAAIFLIALFGYQQVIILQKINELSEQKIMSSEFSNASFTEDYSKNEILKTLNSKQFPGKEIAISDKEIEQMIRSVNKLQLKYKDLFYLIENDPQIKEYVEARMREEQQQQQQEQEQEMRGAPSLKLR
jgi:hypothetical protein